MVQHPFPYLSDLKAKFQEYGLRDVSKITSCSERDISSLEERFSIKLPKAYREFLLWMGRDGGLFLQKQYRYEVLPIINAGVYEILARKQSGFFLPRDAFVIGIELSESFYFFRCSEGENPPIYIFMDEEEQGYMRGERTMNEVPREWAFLFDKPKKDFSVFSASFTEYLNYWLNVYFETKKEAKELEYKRRNGPQDNT